MHVWGVFRRVNGELTKYFYRLRLLRSLTQYITEIIAYPMDKTCVEHRGNPIVPAVPVAVSICRGNEAHGEEEEDHL